MHGKFSASDSCIVRPCLKVKLKELKKIVKDESTLETSVMMILRYKNSIRVMTPTCVDFI